MAHPGCVSGRGQRRKYSDGFIFFVTGLMERHSDISVDILAQLILVPAGTLKEWQRRAALPESLEEPASDAQAEQEEPMSRRLPDAKEDSPGEDSLCIDVPEPPNQCKPTGCSGQICAAVEIATTCEWLPLYACFQDANCGPFGPDGACAWEHTDEFSTCLGLNS